MFHFLTHGLTDIATAMSALYRMSRPLERLLVASSFCPRAKRDDPRASLALPSLTAAAYFLSLFTH